MIACIVIPYFAAAVERDVKPALAERALVIVEPGSGRKVVYASCAVAAQAGIRPGLLLRQAQAVCPQAQFIPAGHARYRQRYEQVVAALRTFSPRVEAGDGPALPASGRGRRNPAGPNGQRFVAEDDQSAVCYLDLERLGPDPAVDLARDISRAVRQQTQLTPALGLAMGKFPARLAAASIEPGQVLLIPPGEEAAFLAPLPVTALPLDGETGRRLRLLGIETLGQLARLPAGALATQLGKRGYLLHRLAAGRDSRPIAPYSPLPSELVARQFEAPLDDRAALESALRDIASDLAQRLQAKASVARDLALTLALEYGRLLEERLTVRQPVASAGHIAAVLNQLLGRMETDGGVVAIQVRLAGLAQSTGRQLDLFVQQAGQDRLLRNALRAVVARYGADCFYWVASVDEAARIPTRRFRLEQADGP